MNKLKYYILCFLAGGVLGYFIIPKVPNIKVVKEIKAVDRVKVITKTNTIYADRIIERTITKDGEVKEVVKETIIEKPVEVIKEKETGVVKLESKEKNYTAGVGICVNPFKLSEVAVSGEIRIIGNLYLQNITTIDFSPFTPKTFFGVKIIF